MPWLTILMMLISYFLQSRGSPEERRKAVLGALAAGAVTYTVTHDTEWGRDNLGMYDGVMQTTDEGLKLATAAQQQAVTSGVPIDNDTPPKGTSAWDVLKSWGAAGVATVVGTAAVASGGLSSILPLALLGLGAYLILK